MDSQIDDSWIIVRGSSSMMQRWRMTCSAENQSNSNKWSLMVFHEMKTSIGVFRKSDQIFVR